MLKKNDRNKLGFIQIKLLLSVDEWKEKWSHVPCVRINKKASTNDTRNPEMQLKLNEIRASVMKLKDKAKRRRLLKNLNALMNKMPWENVAGDVNTY